MGGGISWGCFFPRLFRFVYRDEELAMLCMYKEGIIICDEDYRAVTTCCFCPGVAKAGLRRCYKAHGGLAWSRLGSSAVCRATFCRVLGSRHLALDDGVIRAHMHGEGPTLAVTVHAGSVDSGAVTRISQT
jgi:hypothetical protein